MFYAHNVKLKDDASVSAHPLAAYAHGMTVLPFVIEVQAAVVFAKFEQTAAEHVLFVAFQ